VSFESFYEKSERLRRERVALREAKETAENRALFDRLLAEQAQVQEQVAAKVFEARSLDDCGHWTHEQVIASRTGVEVNFDSWIESRARNETIRVQTAKIADALARTGINVRSDSKASLVGLVTGEVVELTSYKATRFLPSIAKRDRREMLNSYIHMNEIDKNVRKHTRYYVFSSGSAVPVFGDFKERMQKHYRDLSKWASAARKRWNVDVLGRFSEYTIAVRGDDDFKSLNGHSNVPIQFPWLGRGGLSDFLRWTHDCFPGLQVNDAGPVEDPEELIKYSFKPCELEDCTDEEIAWLFHETRNMNFMQPMGKFKELRSSLRKSRLKIVSNPEKKGKEDNGPKVIPVLKEVRERREALEKNEDEAKVLCAFILGTTTPQPIHSPWLEPQVMIQNFGCEMKQENQDRLALLQTAARRLWDAQGAPEPKKAIEIAFGLKNDVSRKIVSLRKARIKKAAEATHRAARYRLDTYRLTVRDGPTRGGDNGRGCLESRRARPGWTPWAETG